MGNKHSKADSQTASDPQLPPTAYQDSADTVVPEFDAEAYMRSGPRLPGQSAEELCGRGYKQFIPSK